MAGELSGILEHVDRIGELDLDEVEPTTHVVALENVLRAGRAAAEPGRARTAWHGARTRPTAPSAFPRRRPRPDGGAAGADRRRGGGADRGRGALAPRSTSPPGARRPPATSSTPTSGAPRTARLRGRATGRWAASRSRSRTSSAPRASPTTAGSRILEGYRPPYTRDRGAAARRGRRPACSARPTWTSSRWAPRTRTPPTGRCSTPGTAAAFPAAPRAARRRRSPAGSRPARSAPTPAARSASPPRSAGSSA